MKMLLFIVWAVACLGSCKTVLKPQPHGTAQPSLTAPTTQGTSDGQSVPLTAVGAHPSLGLASAATALPKLKPVTGKWFPEGTNEAMICEAINVKEPDLWLRFGHMIPLFARGTIVVLQAGKAKEAAIAAFAQNTYQPKFEPIQASCGDKTLMYIVYVNDDMDIIRRLEREVGVTMLEHFELPVDEAHRRLWEYCEVGAGLCNDLLNLYDGNLGNGLCAVAMNACRFRFPSEAYSKAIALCKTRPLEQVVCASVTGRRLQDAHCESRIRNMYCP